MADLSPGQTIWRDRVEGVIALAAPALDLLLSVGDRISRIAEPEDHEYYPVRTRSDSTLPAEFERPRVSSGDGD